MSAPTLVTLGARYDKDGLKYVELRVESASRTDCYTVILNDTIRYGMSDQERYEQCERLAQQYAEEAARLQAKLRGASK